MCFANITHVLHRPHSYRNKRARIHSFTRWVKDEEKKAYTALPNAIIITIFLCFVLFLVIYVNISARNSLTSHACCSITKSVEMRHHNSRSHHTKRSVMMTWNQEVCENKNTQTINDHSSDCMKSRQSFCWCLHIFQLNDFFQRRKLKLNGNDQKMTE